MTFLRTPEKMHGPECTITKECMKLHLRHRKRIHGTTFVPSNFRSLLSVHKPGACSYLGIRARCGKVALARGRYVVLRTSTTTL